MENELQKSAENLAIQDAIKFRKIYTDKFYAVIKNPSFWSELFYDLTNSIPETTAVQMPTKQIAEQITQVHKHEIIDE